MPPSNAKRPPSIGAAAWLIHPSTQAVFDALEAEGSVARAVGGCVRNSLFEALNPATSSGQATDIDIATPVRPADVLRLAERAGLKAIETGLAHGTVTVVSDKHPIEVTTLRRDIATDGRHADVAFTDDWSEDAGRRDFTMNAIYADRRGNVFDPLEGYPDVAARRVRFIGDPDARIQEDYLRILRFFRFHAHYGDGPLDRAGLDACARNHRGLARLSGERLRQETAKILVATGAPLAISAMLDWGILPALLRGVAYPQRLAALLTFDPKPDWALQLAALGLSVSEDVERLTDLMRLSRAERATLTRTAPFLTNTAMSSPSDVELRTILYREGLQGFAEITAALVAGLAPTDARALRPRCQALIDRGPVPDFPLTGADLMELGMKPGAQMGEFLRVLQNEWIAESFHTSRDQLIARARELIKRTI